MTAFWKLLVAACFGFASIASAQQVGVFQVRDLSGQELFERFCASCHGDEARGDGPVAPSLSAPVPDLTRIAQRNGGAFPAAAVQQFIDGRMDVIAHGPRTMPVWGYELWWESGADRAAEVDTRELLERLVEYLSGLQR